MKKINVSALYSALIPISMLVYAFRGKYGAVVISLLIIMLLFFAIRKQYIKCSSSFFYAVYLLVFAVIMNFIRTLNFEYYLTVGYFAAFLILFNSKLSLYRKLWKLLGGIAVFEAFGVYLQCFVPKVYNTIISIILPSTVVSSIGNRLTGGYYTGFSREVSYTVFFIAIGLGIYFFDIDIKNDVNAINRKIYKISSIVFLFGALVLSGKRAALLIVIVTFATIQFFRSNEKLKLIKFIAVGILVIIIIWLTFPYWSKVPFFSRIVELIGFINKGDMVGITNGRTVINNNAFLLWDKNRMFGIGWGNFKYSVSKNVWYSGYDVHNCYLQILCENGLVGAIPFYLLIVISLLKSLIYVVKTKTIGVKHHKIALLAAFIQLFFAIYCFAEPILFEYTDYIIYFIAVNIVYLISIEIKDKKMSIGKLSLKR